MAAVAIDNYSLNVYIKWTFILPAAAVFNQFFFTFDKLLWNRVGDTINGFRELWCAQKNCRYFLCIIIVSGKFTNNCLVQALKIQWANDLVENESEREEKNGKWHEKRGKCEGIGKIIINILAYF